MLELNTTTQFIAHGTIAGFWTIAAVAGSSAAQAARRGAVMMM